MGEIIARTAAVERVKADIRKSFDTAVARGDEIEAAARTRLEPSVAAIDTASAAHDAAKGDEQSAWVVVIAIDTKADVGIGDVRDRMWNALGRPRQSRELESVFPGGVGTYTSGDPRNQPILMEVLRTRILTAEAPRWTDAMRQGWAAEIEALRVPYQAAVDAHRAADAALMVAEAGYRSAVRAGHARLVAFKRDLKTLGLTETQIHEIIPDAG